MDTTTQQRRSAILDELVRSRTVRIADLSDQLGVSEVLVRRDLQRLAEQGLLKRIHGGAVALPGAAPAAGSILRAVAHLDEKERIGRAAAALIREEDRIIFDSGTTPLQVARSIPGDLLTNGKLTVITVSLPVVRELGPWKSLHLILLGGIYLPEYEVVVGPQAIENIRDLHADRIFVGTDGMTLSNGVTTANVLEAEVDRALVKSASQVIVVADSSKIGRIGLAPVVPISEIHVLVTDKGAPADFVAEVGSLGVQVILV